MSASTIIGDVTQTLEHVLRVRQQPATLFDVSLLSPIDENVTPGMRPRVNLFLLRLQEHPFGRNRDWEPSGFGEQQYPPLALNLLYMMTAFATDRVDESRVLGEAMRVLHDEAIIRGALLQGVLVGTSEELKVDLCQFSLDDLTKIWNAFNRPLRLTVCYEVRTALIDSLDRRGVTRVTSKVEQWSQI